MPRRVPHRVCLDPHDIRQLHREGLAWGFDLDTGCGCAELPARPGGLMHRLVRLMKGT